MLARFEPYRQSLYRKWVKQLQARMGIGIGSYIDDSGEKYVLNLLRPGNARFCIFDIGANKGDYTNSALRVLPNSVVHCFEPSKITFELLKNSIDSTRMGNVRLNNAAVGNENGRRVLYSNKDGSGMASLTKRNLDHRNIQFDKIEEINITTLDAYCDQNEIERIHLLKVDVEGHELDVFQGGMKMFQKKAIDVIAFEFGGCNIDTRTFFKDFWYFLKSFDMSIFRITPTGYLQQITKYAEEDEQFRTTNFVAVRKGYKII